MKKCLSIAGSDCSGGAGIQADLKAFSANGTFGMSVITSVVAENTSRVLSVFNVPVEEIEKQIDTVFEDIEVDCVKLGMLPSPEIVRAVAEKLKQYKPKFIVCDPVLVATSGDPLSSANTISAFTEHIFPIADLITPNIQEAEAFADIQINGIDDMVSAAQRLQCLGAKNVLVKGGHLDGQCIDVFYDGKAPHLFKAQKINSPNTHGTGCTLSSAIAANLACGMELRNAIENAKTYVTTAIERSFTVGKGHSPVNHFYDYYDLKGINYK